MKITVEESVSPGAFQAVVWGREGLAPVFFTDRCNSVAEAKERAEVAFGLLDWGKGGQPMNQAVIGLDY